MMTQRPFHLTTCRKSTHSGPPHLPPPAGLTARAEWPMLQAGEKEQAGSPFSHLLVLLSDLAPVTDESRTEVGALRRSAAGGTDFGELSQVVRLATAYCLLFRPLAGAWGSDSLTPPPCFRILDVSTFQLLDVSTF